MKLDKIDQSLLSVLSRDARVTNRELARRVGLSTSACGVRVKRLEEEGIIVGYRAIVARDGSGQRLEGWADIRFLEPTPETIRDFTRLVEAAPDIVEAHRIAGHFDYTIRFCTSDLHSWNRFRQNLDAIDSKSLSRFTVLIEALK